MSARGPRADAYDYVIVGAGSAGCVLARRLSAAAECRVLLLEAGPPDRRLATRVPMGFLRCIGDPVIDWRYRTEPEAMLLQRSIALPRGRLLGGSSAINGMVYIRGHAFDYDRWETLGNPGWAWRDVLPRFRRSEDHHLGASEYHGSGGEMRIEAQRVSFAVTDAFVDACDDTGIARVADFNRGENTGAGYYEVTQRRGIRVSSAGAFLARRARRPNLHVLTGARVLRVVVEGGRVSGVEIAEAGQTRVIRADRELILCAGAIGTPHLLQLSGIGDPARLEAAGIRARHALPGVGGNLQDHLNIRTIHRLRNASTLNDRVRSIAGRARIGLSYALNRSGPLAMAPSPVGAFIRSEPGLPAPDLQIHVQPLSLDVLGQPLHPFPAITVAICQVRPESRGRVDAISPDPAVPPRIVANFLAEAADRALAVRSVDVVREIMAAKPFASLFPEEYRPGAGTDVLDFVRRGSNTGHHAVGTCPMGTAADSVVDATLGVRGLTGLRIADASAMPRMPSGNTHAPTVMIAEAAAEFIAGATSGRPLTAGG